jgi:hypothetical protein
MSASSVGISSGTNYCELINAGEGEEPTAAGQLPQERNRYGSSFADVREPTPEACDEDLVIS